MYNKIIKITLFLLIFLLPLFFLPFSFEAFEFNKQYLLFFLVSFALFVWLVRMIIFDKEIKFRKTILDAVVLIFLIIATLSAVFSVSGFFSFFGYYGRFSDGLIGTISLVLMYFVLSNNLKSEETPEENNNSLTVSGIINIFSWSALFVVLISFLSVFGFFGFLNKFLKFLPNITLSRIFNPVAGSLEGLAVFLSIIIILSVAKILSLKTKSKLNSILNYFLLISSLVLLIIIGFKIPWIIISVSLVLFVFFALIKRTFKKEVNKLILPISLIILSLIFIILNASKIQTGLLGLQLPKEQFLSQKTSLGIGLKAATESIKSVFFGSGIGNWYYDFSKFKPANFNQSPLWDKRLDRAGSYVAEIIGTMGLLGILSYLFLIIMFFIVIYFFFQGDKDGIALILFMVFLGLLTSQFVFYQNSVLAFTFWLTLALIVGSWKKTPLIKTISLKNFPELSIISSSVLIVVGLGLLVCYFFAFRFYLADIYYVRYLKNNDISKIEKAVSLDPYQPYYTYEASLAYLGKIDNEIIKPAEQIDQTAFSNMAQTAINYAKGGEINKTKIRGTTELAPNWIVSQEVLGRIYRDIESLVPDANKFAIESFTKAINLEPTNPVLHTELGKLYINENNLDQAKKEFATSQGLKPDYIDNLIQLALIPEKENNPDESVKQLEAITAKYVVDTDTLTKILFEEGRIYYKDGKYDEAIAKFKQIISLVPKHANAHYVLGLAYEKKGDIVSARAEFQAVLETNPNNPVILREIDALNASKNSPNLSVPTTKTPKK